ncbi:chorismate synthase [Picrophilus oshimae]|uniref:Chorismate synthase n=1 Tax=Picrophilus torridus (strain ATCC 700027 / DSM 9790 / JCM 10055 / NBRC 100828 / KAW 2/3) TaxID=1122961 RepID=Q6L2E5_PICTO|nr:chorismate synthase [Picrophilus oshimae]AAT42857.1 chorismate synthase [Picrophilus oshimae DSM 9789]SMD31618.1 chorismate synthase [Picrophilus oshimae DSM 9789]
MFILGNKLKLSVFGSSHGKYVGGSIDGLPAGISIDYDYSRKWLDRRKPAQSEITTQRKEDDDVEIIAGIHNGYTDGSPLVFLTKNRDYIDRHYDDLYYNPRPGHADLTMYYKYGDYRNFEGGGFFSGRMTLPLVFAGSIAMRMLRDMNITVVSYIKKSMDIVYNNDDDFDEDYPYNFSTRIPDKYLDERLHALIMKTIKEGDSLGAVIRTRINNVPPGIGEPFFDSIESNISKAMFSIPAVKGIAFGAGFNLSNMKGSESNDEFYYDEKDKRIKTRTNNAGGILGGISNGMPIEFDVVVKPASSIRIKQKTVNLKTLDVSEIIVKGRHDPFIAFRAVPVVQCMSAFIILDFILEEQHEKH